MFRLLLRRCVSSLSIIASNGRCLLFDIVTLNSDSVRLLFSFSDSSSDCSLRRVCSTDAVGCDRPRRIFASLIHFSIDFARLSQLKVQILAKFSIRKIFNSEILIKKFIVDLLCFYSTFKGIKIFQLDSNWFRCSIEQCALALYLFPKE